MITIILEPVSDGSTLRYVPHNMSNRRMHWRTKNEWNKAWKAEVGYQVMEHKLKRDKKEFADVHIVFFTIRKMDRDGAYNAAKPVLDGLVEAELIEDDSEEHIDLKVSQIKVGKVKEQKVIIHISD